jgi:glucokinase
LPAELLAVDVGGSSVKHGLVVDGTLGRHEREPVARDLESLVEQLTRIHAEAGAPDWGLSIAGLVDSERGVVRYAANLPLRDAPLRELLPEPRIFVNDLVAATVGEADGGTLALLQAGTGLAGRYAQRGRVAGGPLAGEIGHLPFRAGLACRCGRDGCAEAYGAWGGILERHAAARRPAPTPASLLEAAESDSWAREVLDDALAAIGFAAAALVSAYDPGALRVGGGLAAAWGETLLDAVRSTLAAGVLAQVAVEPARLGDAAPLLGLYRLSLEV